MSSNKKNPHQNIKKKILHHPSLTRAGVLEVEGALLVPDPQAVAALEGDRARHPGPPGWDPPAGRLGRVLAASAKTAPLADKDYHQTLQP